MKCKNCNAEIPDGSRFCPVCGKNVNEFAPNQQQFSGNQVSNTQDEDYSIWMKILCLIIPIVGIILYFVKKDQEPVKAKSALTFGLIAVGINVLYYML